MKKILIINGPNLNMLGKRQPEIYGHKTLDDIKNECENLAKTLQLAIDFRQSNVEGEIVEWIQQAAREFSGIIINAGAYSHTSIAIRDAIIGGKLAVVEVHISNIFRREQFRHHSYISEVAVGMITGLGSHGYKLALDFFAQIDIAHPSE